MEIANDYRTGPSIKLLEWPDEKINRKIFNAGYENFPISELARQVKEIVGHEVVIVTEPTDDPRSYHISSKKISYRLELSIDALLPG